MDEHRDFIGKLQKWGSKPYKIKDCLGARDAFHWVRKNGWKALGGIHCDKLLYSQIISEVNKILAERLLDGHEIEFPYQMGSLLVIRKPPVVHYDGGKLKTNYRTDWKKTIDFICENPDNRLYIKRVQPFIYSIRYYKRKAKYKNRRFYNFRVNRSLVRKLGAAVEGGRVMAEEQIFELIKRE